jgi:hypothetical protein
MHTIRYLQNNTNLSIPATDVNIGTFPAGSSWRLNPIPACSCDWGRGCKVNGAVLVLWKMPLKKRNQHKNKTMIEGTYILFYI